MVGCIQAKIAFVTFPGSAISRAGRDARPLGSERTFIITTSATHTLALVNHPDIAVGFIDGKGAGGTGVDTGVIFALMTLVNASVIGKTLKGTLNDLQSGLGKVDDAFMGQGAGDHAGQASLTFA